MYILVNFIFKRLLILFEFIDKLFFYDIISIIVIAII